MQKPLVSWLLLPAVLQDPRVERIACTHKGTYADDCLCERVRQHKCYIVATCDKDLRRRIRKVRRAGGGCGARYHVVSAAVFIYCGQMLGLSGCGNDYNNSCERLVGHRATNGDCKR
jgi:hypothetical protein